MSIIKTIFSKTSNILETYPYPTIIISDKGKILYANDYANQLLESNSLANKIITDYFDISVDYIVNLEEISPDNEIKPLLLLNSNKFIDIKSSKIPEKEEYLLALQDVTNQVKSFELLHQFQRQESEINGNKNIFLVKMANNIKSPLHSIIGFSQAILEGLGGDINPKQEKYLKIIHKNSSELLILIEKIINLSQIEAKMYAFNYKTFDILNTVTTISNEYRQGIEEKRLNLIIDAESFNKKPCYTDENIIKIIVGNLIENAILSCELGSITLKLSTPDEKLLNERDITIETEEDLDKYLLLEVIDTGNGIHETDMPDIFNPYAQVDKSSKKNMTKSLILAITKEFTNQLGGEIWVESELLKNSTYKVLIPIEKASENG